MGALSNAIADAGRAAGAEIRTAAQVARVEVRGGRAVGIALADGTSVRARAVVSAVHPKTTFLDLVGSEHLPADLVADIERFRSRATR
jgi:phytoene dehydrogenase-like protein